MSQRRRLLIESNEKSNEKTLIESEEKNESHSGYTGSCNCEVREIRKMAKSEQRR